jgi:hypothetical protein
VIGDGQLLEFGNQSPVTADDSLDESRVAQVIQATVLAIPLTARVNECEVMRATCCGLGIAAKEALLQRNGQIFSESDADESTSRNSVAILDLSNGLCSADDLVAIGNLRF